MEAGSRKVSVRGRRCASTAGLTDGGVRERKPWSIQEMLAASRKELNTDDTLILDSWDIFWTPDLQNCKLIHFCCFKLLCLWQCVTINNKKLIEVETFFLALKFENRIYRKWPIDEVSQRSSFPLEYLVVLIKHILCLVDAQWKGFNCICGVKGRGLWTVFWHCLSRVISNNWGYGFHSPRLFGYGDWGIIGFSCKDKLCFAKFSMTYDRHDPSDFSSFFC